jgi:hypothetical protein
MVTHPNELVRNTVRHYLNNERTFIIAGSSNPDHKGHRIPIRANPNESDSHMKMALCEMFHNTGVHVNWGHEDNDLTEQPDPNAQADKPILKSIDGEDIFEILN